MKINEVAQLDQVDEGIGRYLKYIGSRMGSLFSQRLKGKAQLLKASSKVLNMFQQAMGRRNEKYKNVTWGSLENFLSNPSLLGLSQSRVSQLINNSKIKNQIMADWNKLSGGLVPPDDAWGVEDQPIGGESNDRMAAKLAEIAVTYIVELAVIEYLENRTKASQPVRTKPSEPDTYQKRKPRNTAEPTEPSTSDDDEKSTPSPEPVQTSKNTIPTNSLPQVKQSPWLTKPSPKGQSQIPVSPVQSVKIKVTRDQLTRIKSELQKLKQGLGL